MVLRKIKKADTGSASLNSIMARILDLHRIISANHTDRPFDENLPAPMCP